MGEEKEKRSFIAWVKAHKKELIITGIGIAGVVITIAILKKKNVPKLNFALKDPVEEILNEKPEIKVGTTSSASPGLFRVETNDKRTQGQVSSGIAKQLNHVFRAQKQGWEKEYDGIWFDSSCYTREQAASEIKPFQALTQRGYPYTGYEFDGQKYYNYIYLGLFESDKMPGTKGIIDDVAM